MEQKKISLSLIERVTYWFEDEWMNHHWIQWGGVAIIAVSATLAFLGYLI
jgi:hypothetical protein